MLLCGWLASSVPGAELLFFTFSSLELLKEKRLLKNATSLQIPVLRHCDLIDKLVTAVRIPIPAHRPSRQHFSGRSCKQNFLSASHVGEIWPIGRRRTARQISSSQNSTLFHKAYVTPARPCYSLNPGGFTVRRPPLVRFHPARDSRAAAVSSVQEALAAAC